MNGSREGGLRVIESSDPRNEVPPSAPASIAESRERLLREISGSPDVTFIRAGGNIGDDLIHAGTRQLLASVFYEEVKLRKRSKEEVREPGSIRRLLPGTSYKKARMPRHREVGIG